MLFPILLGGGANPANNLNFRQDDLFLDTCDIIGYFVIKNSDGKGKARDTYRILRSGVRYEHAPTPNIADPSPVGRRLRPTILTTDIATFAIGDGPPDGAIIRNTTVQRNGVNGPKYGQFFRILGIDRSEYDDLIMEWNDSIYDLRILQPADVPPLVLALYA